MKKGKGNKFFMKKIMHMLKRFSRKVAYMQTFLILTIVYVLVVPFFALLFVIFKDKAQSNKTSWSTWKLRADTLDDLKKQF